MAFKDAVKNAKAKKGKKGGKPNPFAKGSDKAPKKKGKC